MNNYILIIEDDVLVAENTAFTLNQAGYRDTYITDNLLDAIKFQKRNKIALIISDINLHGCNTGINLVKELQNNKQTPVIFLTAYSEEQILNEALQTNPIAFVLKPFTDRQLLVAVQIAFKQIAESDTPGSIDKPSPRELQVIEQIAKGLSNREIADFLYLSEHTIKAHRRNLIRKYQLRSSSELIALSIRLKWINVNNFIK
jgi:DNA-binding NarL/FixJ family response regulator